MTEEPTYIDEGDEEGLWGDTNWKYTDDLDHLDIVHAAFAVTRRTALRFNDKPERTRWERITVGITKGKIPKAWVEHMIQWARDKNRGLVKIAITLPKLTGAILNKGRMADWVAQNPQAAETGKLVGSKVSYGEKSKKKHYGGDPYAKETTERV